MARPPRVAVVGSCNTDLITFTDTFPRAGETLFGRRFDLGFGGKGANQAVAARLCGAEVLMVAKVGDDLFGEATVENFASFGIDTRHVKIVPGVSTGAAAILVEPNGDNRIIVVKGANDDLRAADIDAAAPLLRQVDTLILQFEVPLDTVYHAVHFARTHGIRCIVNPAPALPADLARLAEADYLIPNETEAEQLAGRSVRTLDDARDCARELLRRGFRRLVLTLGSRGSLLASPEALLHVAPYEVTPVDTTGAGDAFIGSLAVFLAEGMPEREALAAANLYAALSTTRVGTQKSFPTRAEFDHERARRIGP
jgi:ribokinase